MGNDEMRVHARLLHRAIREFRERYVPFGTPGAWDFVAIEGQAKVLADEMTLAAIRRDAEGRETREVCDG